MRRALSLAERALGDPSPNPMVGAVVVRDDEIVGEGYHAAQGADHAEVVAIRHAGSGAKGATLFLTLEPCVSHGLTPPCVDLIIDVGIQKVVIAQTDPDSRVSGKGIDKLRAAGITVDVGLLGAEASEQLIAYRHQRTTERPFVVLKLAITVDGASAAPDGTSQWITGPKARADVQRLRRASDAIVVGSGTVLSDDPRLTVRTEPAPRSQPIRIVMDRRGRVPRTARVFTEEGEAFATGLSPAELIESLAERRVLQVLIEGGAAVAGAFAREQLIDRYQFYLGPVLAGGDNARHALAGPAFGTIADFQKLKLLRMQRFDDDVRLDYEPAGRLPAAQ